MKTYKFTCYDHDDDTTTVVKFTTENDTWSGYDGPAHNFFNFLKGCGYLFSVNTHLGFLDERTGEFRNSAD